MGSSQSSQSTSSSFMVDPDGNIRPKSTSSDNVDVVQTESERSHESPASTMEEPIKEPINQIPQYEPSFKSMPLKRNPIDEYEKNLVHCYAMNKTQPLNCSNVYKQYKDCIERERRQQINWSASNNTRLLSSMVVVMVCLILHLTTVHCFGAMSIDLGSEWMKVGLVSSSTQMDIVLNAQSQRKTSMAIAFLNGDRYVGDAAMEIASKYPKNTFTHFLDLVGKTIDDDSVSHYKRRFPYADITSDEPNSPSILLKHPEGLSFTPLELIVMMIQHAHDQVANSLKNQESVHDVVITVPPFFGTKERAVIEDATRLAGLNLLRLTNVNSAFALSYGIFRHKDYQPESSENRTTILFFDQGASSSSATLADYFLVDQYDENTGAKIDPIPTISIRAQVYDRFLGGFDMQLRLRDHLIGLFAKKYNIKESKIYERGKSVSKFLKEAGRIKRVLSANNDHTVRIESVIDDKDFALPFSRQDYEDLNNEFMNTRIVKLLDSLYQMPNVSYTEPIESVIIVGGNTRTPKIQQVLLDYFKVETLGKSINADEGAALAALYQAAAMSRGFRTKKFLLVEFGETIKRFDPSTITTTTSTTTTTTTTTTTETPPSSSTEGSEIPVSENLDQAEATTSSNNTETPTTTTTTTTAPEVATTTEAPPKPRNSFYSDAELERIGQKLAKMRQQDFERMQLLSLRNSFESLLSQGREKISEDDERIRDKKDEIQKIIAETYDWLEDGPQGETHNITLIVEKMQLIHQLINPEPVIVTPTLQEKPADNSSTHNPEL